MLVRAVKIEEQEGADEIDSSPEVIRKTKTFTKGVDLTSIYDEHGFARDIDKIYDSIDEYVNEVVSDIRYSYEKEFEKKKQELESAGWTVLRTRLSVYRSESTGTIQFDCEESDKGLEQRLAREEAARKKKEEATLKPKKVHTASSQTKKTFVPLSRAEVSKLPWEKRQAYQNKKAEYDRYLRLAKRFGGPNG